MHGVLGEVIAPELPGLIIAIGAIIGSLLLLALIFIVQALVQAIFGGLEKIASHVPGLGTAIAAGLGIVTQWIISTLAEAEKGVDGALAFWLHELGLLWRYTVETIAETSHLVEALTGFLFGTGRASLLNQLAASVAVALHATDVGLHRLERKVRAVEHTAIATAETWLAPRLHRLEHTIEHTVELDIAGLRARARSLVDQLDALWKRVRKLDKLVGTAAFAGVVAVALTHLGLSWIRCKNWSKIGKAVCGLPLSLIEDVLAMGLAFAAVVDPVALAEAADALEAALEPIIEKIAD